MTSEIDTRAPEPSGGAPEPRPPAKDKEPWFLRLAVQLLVAGLAGHVVAHFAFFRALSFGGEAIARGAYLMLPIMATGALVGGAAGAMPALTAGDWRVVRNVGLPVSFVTAALVGYAASVGLGPPAP